MFESLADIAHCHDLRVACDDSPPQQFVYNTDTTAIRLANTDLCVEFSSGRGANGHPLRIQNCRSKGPPGQRLVVDGDRIRLQKGPGLCADVKDGVVVDGVGRLQSWRRVEGNNHQVCRDSFRTLDLRGRLMICATSPTTELLRTTFPTSCHWEPSLPGEVIRRSYRKTACSPHEPRPRNLCTLFEHPVVRVVPSCLGVLGARRG